MKDSFFLPQLNTEQLNKSYKRAHIHDSYSKPTQFQMMSDEIES